MKPKRYRFFIKYSKAIVICSTLCVLILGFIVIRNIIKAAKRIDFELKASALSGGEYSKFLDVFVDVINSDSINNHVQLERINSPGASGSTIDQIDKGNADIGLCQLNAPLNSRRVKSIAYVYIEPFFLITHKKEIYSVSDIAKSKNKFSIARLPMKSQTSLDLMNLINFYGIDTAKIEFIDASYDHNAELLKQRKADIGFFITGFGNKTIQELIRDSSMHLIRFENIKAYTLTRPKLMSFSIPRGVYGLNCPSIEYETLASKAMLIVRSTLSNNEVYKLTRTLFEKESEIAEKYPYLRLERIQVLDHSYIPLHKGAQQYYDKDGPSFLNRNSTIINIVLAVLGLILPIGLLIIEYRIKKHKTKD